MKKPPQKTKSSVRRLKFARNIQLFVDYKYIVSELLSANEINRRLCLIHMQRGQRPLHSLLDKRVGQSVVDGEPLRRIQDEDLLEEVLELRDFAELIFRHPLSTDHVRQQVLAWTDRTHHGHFLLHTVCYQLATTSHTNNKKEICLQHTANYAFTDHTVKSTSKDYVVNMEN